MIDQASFVDKASCSIVSISNAQIYLSMDLLSGFDKPSEKIPTLFLIYSQMPRIMNDPFAFVQSWKIFHKVTQVSI